MNAYTWWISALAGQKPLTYETPECGYFKIRDRRGANKHLAAIKRPWVACAIWLSEGEFKAELGGSPIDVDRVWPWCARFPITFESYTHWHQHNTFLEDAA